MSCMPRRLALAQRAAKGPIGPQGPQGARAPLGPKGPQGSPEGMKIGPPGPPGARGTLPEGRGTLLWGWLPARQELATWSFFRI